MKKLLSIIFIVTFVGIPNSNLVGDNDDLHFAAAEGELNKVKQLIKSGINVNQKDFFGDTALHYTAMNDEREVAEYLLKKGADINSEGSNNKTPLHYAADRAFPEFIEMLLKNKAHVDSLDAQGKTPLHDAFAFNPKRWRRTFDDNKLKCANFLIQYKANINAINEKGQTPLFLAVENDNLKGTTWLLAHGADQTIKNKNNESPYDIAKKHNFESILNALEKSVEKPEESQIKKNTPQKTIKKIRRRRRARTKKQ